MSNLKILRTRIKSIKSTSKITKAMQLVSATKLTKIKKELGEAEYYLDAVANIAASIARACAGTNNNNIEDLPENLKKYFISNDKAVLLIIFTSEKGLCGSFNSNVIKNVKQDIENFLKAGKAIKLIIIGTKGYNLLKNLYPNLIEAYFIIPKETERLFISIKSKIMELLDSEAIGECHLYFNKFKNAILQFFVKKQILPINNIENKNSKVIDYEYEGENLIEKLLTIYINSQINYALLENKAGEEGARMSAMDNATKNANEIVDNLTIKLNRSRQAIITSELIEIIAGAESL